VVAIATGDLDSDDDIDFVLGRGNGVAESNVVYLNDGDASFSLWRELDINESVDIIVAPITVDDGTLDILSVNRGGANDILWVGDGSGGFVEHPTQIASGGNARSGSVGDVDGDGDLDYLVTRFGGQDVIVFLNRDVHAFPPSGDWLSNPIVPSYPNAIDATFADLEADGDLDIVAVVNSVGGIQFWQNDDATPDVDVTFSDGGSFLWAGDPVEVYAAPIIPVAP
jgi:hypothetical protein